MMLFGANPDLCAVDATTASSSGRLANILRLFRLRVPDAIQDEGDGEKINRTPSSGCSLCSGHPPAGGGGGKRENATAATRFDSSLLRRCTFSFFRFRKKKRSRSPINNNVAAISSLQSTSPELESANKVNLENLVHCALITLVTVVVYSNAVHGDFVHDDVAAIVTNKDALGKSPVLNLLHNDFWGMDIKDRLPNTLICPPLKKRQLAARRVCVAVLKVRLRQLHTSLLQLKLHSGVTEGTSLVHSNPHSGITG